jgi:exodeoxyribonuclease III
MKIITWNVNGIRSLIKKNILQDLIQKEKPNILCLNETKLNNEHEHHNDIDKILNFNYSYWHISTIKKGYSGTAIFTDIKPNNIIFGLKDNNDNELDFEGRVITIEFNDFNLILVYTPNSGEELKRLDFRTNIWDRAFEKHINNFNNKKLIITGDLNVAHKEIDIKNPKKHLRSAGFTIEERESFNKILFNNNLIDTFRYLHNDKILYSYWSYRGKAREKNLGWRLDYFLINKLLINNLKKSEILIDILGSDHAPIKLKLDL